MTKVGQQLPVGPEGGSGRGCEEASGVVDVFTPQFAVIHVSVCQNLSNCMLQICASYSVISIKLFLKSCI